MNEYSKKVQARIIFNEVHSKDYDLQGRSRHCEFVRRAQLEIKDPVTGLVCCSKGWANAYFLNRQNWMHHVQRKTGKSMF